MDIMLRKALAVKKFNYMNMSEELQTYIEKLRNKAQGRQRKETREKRKYSSMSSMMVGQDTPPRHKLSGQLSSQKKNENFDFSISSQKAVVNTSAWNNKANIAVPSVNSFDFNKL